LLDFLCELYYDARIHELQDDKLYKLLQTEVKCVHCCDKKGY